jgi:muconolactone delta-isomerase
MVKFFMLFMLQVKLAKPSEMSNQEFYGVWEKEAEAVMAGMKAGVLKAAYKVPGKQEVITIMDVDTADDLDQIYNLPIAQLGYSHLVIDILWTPLRLYENWVEDLKKLAHHERVSA